MTKVRQDKVCLRRKLKEKIRVETIREATSNIKDKSKGEKKIIEQKREKQRMREKNEYRR